MSIIAEYQELIRDCQQYLTTLSFPLYASKEEFPSLNQPTSQRQSSHPLPTAPSSPIPNPTLSQNTPSIPRTPLIEKTVPKKTMSSAPPQKSLPKKSSFRLHPLPSPEEDDIEAIRLQLSKSIPEIKFHTSIPSDDKAKQISEAWKYKNIIEPIVLLSYKENEKLLKFLFQLRRSLSAYFLPAKIISATILEKENQWEQFLSSKNLRLILLSDVALWQLPRLKAHFRQDPQKQSFLQNTPLILLPDLSLYLQEPLLKASLWSGLQQTINTLHIP